MNEGPAIKLWSKGVGVPVSTLSSGSAGIKADANVARNGRETIRNFIVMYRDELLKAEELLRMV